MDTIIGKIVVFFRGMATKSEIWGHMQIYSNSKRVCEEVFIRHIPFLLISYLVNWHIEL